MLRVEGEGPALDDVVGSRHAVRYTKGESHAYFYLADIEKTLEIFIKSEPLAFQKFWKVKFTQFWI